MWRENNPIRYLYCNLKTHSKERGIGFSLTFQEFKTFCEETDYHNRKGRTPDAYTIDRLDPNGPYSRENIRILSHAENSERKDKPYDPTTDSYDGPDPF